MRKILTVKKQLHAKEIKILLYDNNEVPNKQILKFWVHDRSCKLQNMLRWLFHDQAVILWIVGGITVKASNFFDISEACRFILWKTSAH